MAKFCKGEGHDYECTFIMKDKKHEKVLVNECVIYVKKYFALHDSTVVAINELIQIILDRNMTPGEGLDEWNDLNMLINNELEREFIKTFELLKSTLTEMKECIEKMKRVKKIIEKRQIESTTRSVTTTMLHSLNVFFNNTLPYFKRDYMLKEKLHQTLIHVDGACENEINRLQLMWKETPFLHLIFQKFDVNKFIVDCKQFLGTS
ncbi:conserved Plasmodium protein, unknown function [Plasmodium ovale curtisi]|uniref:Uncharacterized protein n=2 Tax=Plasmodium ovale TaxID=36330 RepID=A0A1A8VM05_PLAOA|nr:conserved Plasmodium protein, unknown function [Plasmodium ovale curtisi]SBS84250.1 conserved Plasmodium protein, unknown function [Plasmodium ovale curtisi]